MLFGLLVSKKKYDELKEIALKGQDDLIETQQVLNATRIELEKQVAINEELRSFSEKFKEFYGRVTQMPMDVKNSGPVITVKGSVTLADREMSYGDVVSHMKSQLIYDLAKRLEVQGCVKFDLAEDPITGGVAYIAAVSVYKEGGF